MALLPLGIAAGAQFAGTLLGHSGRPRADVGRLRRATARATPFGTAFDRPAPAVAQPGALEAALQAQGVRTTAEQQAAIQQLQRRAQGLDLVAPGRFAAQAQRLGAQQLAAARGQRGRANVGVLRGARQAAAGMPQRFAAAQQEAELREQQAAQRALSDALAMAAQQEIEAGDLAAQQELADAISRMLAEGERAEDLAMGAQAAFLDPETMLRLQLQHQRGN